MDRRKFIRNGALACSTMLINGGPLLGQPLFPGNDPDLVVSTVADPYRSTLASIEALGGIEKFIRSGDVVGLLINSDFEIEGTFTCPDITIAIIELCKEAGAKKIVLLQMVKENYWTRSSRYPQFAKMIPELVQVESNIFPANYNEKDFIIIPEISGAVCLKELEMVRLFPEVDAFINLPIGKHHGLTLFTGALKNMMGLNTRKSNVNFHLGSGLRNDPEYLAQCIAELCLVRKTDLVVSDSLKVLVTNGPSGPGEIASPGKIVAGRDPVAVDAYGGLLLGYQPDQVLTTVKAHQIGVGSMDLDKLVIKEIS